MDSTTWQLKTLFKHTALSTLECISLLISIITTIIKMTMELKYGSNLLLTIPSLTSGAGFNITILDFMHTKAKERREPIRQDGCNSTKEQGNWWDKK